MEIYKSIDDFQKPAFPVLTTGTFDGVHLGHKKILHRVNQLASEHNGESVLLTFEPHPRMVLFPDQTDLKLINTRDEKIQLLEKSGVKHLIIHPFTKDFAKLSSIDFVRDLLVKKIGVKKLVIGYNHQFGRNREGTLKHLKEYGPLHGFDVEEIPAEDIDNVNISSTKIRHALISGDLITARQYLGYDYFISGTVVKGHGIGKVLDFPTANIAIDTPLKLIPENGVFAVKVLLDDRCYLGMLNIGFRPTVNNNPIDPQPKSIEVNIFDFDSNIYDKQITVVLIEKIREEKRFENTDELKRQLHKDQTKSLRILN